MTLHRWVPLGIRNQSGVEGLAANWNLRCLNSKTTPTASSLRRRRSRHRAPSASVHERAPTSFSQCGGTDSRPQTWVCGVASRRCLPSGSQGPEPRSNAGREAQRWEAAGVGALRDSRVLDLRLLDLQGSGREIHRDGREEAMKQGRRADTVSVARWPGCWNARLGPRAIIVPSSR